MLDKTVGGSTRAAKAGRTQWAAQFLAAAELVRLGYIVSFTMGNNTPMADLMVGHPDSGMQFWVDVKGLSGSGAWLLGDKKDLLNLYYILVRVGSTRERDRFFILTQAEAKDLIKKYWATHPPSASRSGFNLADAEPHKGRWDKLPLGNPSSS